MKPNVLLFGWNRSVPGRESLSAKHFEEFVAFLTSQQQKGSFDRFEIVFLDPHGGDLNGFFLIHGAPAKLEAFTASEDWNKHIMRAILHLQGVGVVGGLTGASLMERMKLWTSLIPA